MTYASLVSYHTNPYTCGVARFNQSLAATLRLPLKSLASYLEKPAIDLVLVSIKPEELDATTRGAVELTLQNEHVLYDLFLHGYEGSSLETTLCAQARFVFAANGEIASQVQLIRTDVKAVFAPGARDLPEQQSVDCELLTFGMAHKIRSDGYRRLAEILRGDSRTFRLDISTALHEGGSFDENFFVVGEDIAAAFSGNVRFLGFLADSEVSSRLHKATALVAFFPRGARENNTTVLSAMTHGCPVITNLDALSPPWMKHGETLFDVARLTRFPDQSTLHAVGMAGKSVAAKFSFEALAVVLAGHQH